MNENNKFANQFIDLWQENFAKMMASDANMRQMQQVLESMKGFYATGDSTNKPTSAANSDAHGDGNIAELISALSRRIDGLERRLADIERNNS